jgi:hypothetical protein
MFKMKSRGGASAMPGSVTMGGEENLTLVFGSVYHVMNSTCIDMRALGLNIYMYKRGKIYEEPPGEIHKCKRLL